MVIFLKEFNYNFVPVLIIICFLMILPQRERWYHNVREISQIETDLFRFLKTKATYWVHKRRVNVLFFTFLKIKWNGHWKEFYFSKLSKTTCLIRRILIGRVTRQCLCRWDRSALLRYINTRDFSKTLHKGHVDYFFYKVFKKITHALTHNVKRLT